MSSSDRVDQSSNDRERLLPSSDEVEAASSTPAIASSVDQQIRGQIRGQVLSSLAATFGGVLVGLALAYSSTAIPSIRADPTAPTVSPAAASLIGAAVPLGGLFGGLFAGPAAQIAGRRNLMIWLAVPALTGWLMIGYAASTSVIVIGRCLTGVFAGITSNVAPTYVAEVTEPLLRGALGASYQLMVTVGVLASYALGMQLAWRWLAVVGAGLPVLWLVLLAGLSVESPSWLMRRGRTAAALDALLWLRGDSLTARQELNTTGRSVRQDDVEASTDADGTISFCEIIRESRHRRPLLMSLTLMFLQQLCGINAVIFYTKDIFIAAGSHMDPGLATLLVGAVQVLATLASVLLVDRLGRRPLLNLSAATMCVCLLALSAFFHLKSPSLAWLPLPSLLIYICAFSIGYGPIPWLMMSELFSPEAMPVAGAVATSFNWTLAFVVTITFGPLQAVITTAGVFMLFGVVCALAVFYSSCCLLETRGRSLQQISEHFAR